MKVLKNCIDRQNCLYTLCTVSTERHACLLYEEISARAGYYLYKSKWFIFPRTNNVYNGWYVRQKDELRRLNKGESEVDRMFREVADRFDPSKITK